MKYCETSTKVRVSKISTNIFLVSSRDSLSVNCLSEYLAQDAARSKKFLVGPEAEIDAENFATNIASFTQSLEENLSSAEREFSYLALGKIQSGKTAHMMGMVAWAANNSIAFMTILTGITDDLNIQTHNRLQETFGEMSHEYIRTFNIPTNPNSKEFKEMLAQIENLIEARISNNSNDSVIPLPVITSLKTVPRLEALKHLHILLLQKFGPELVTLILDDEADQASQNSLSQKRKSTAVYTAISEARKVQFRNIYMAYTATPQAVLLTDRFGELRPDYCMLVYPRKNYFGLSSINEPSYAQNLETIQDFYGKSDNFDEIPESLRNSIYDFYFNSVVKDLFPQVFYLESKLGNAAESVYPSSTQMLIHESALTNLHKSMFKLVDNEILAIAQDLQTYLAEPPTAESSISLKSELQGHWKRILDRQDSNVAGKLPEVVSQEMIECLLSLVENSQIVVVNSAKNRPNKEVDFPSSGKIWNSRKCWILIGGDILGRGLTIPQLVTTYFMRSSKIPNFDTVSQQMRFCGYRFGYKNFTSIWAPEQTFAGFRYMNDVETVIWNRASKWDEERINIKKDLPKVFYAAPLGVNMEPTRKSVRDPELLDLKVKGEVIFEASRILNPIYFRSNFSFIRSWVSDLENRLRREKNWHVIDDLPKEDLYTLFSNWACSNDEKSQLLGANELFSADLESLGLSQVPCSILIANEVLTFPPIRDYEDLKNLCRTVKVGRSIRNKVEHFTLSDWWRSLSGGTRLEASENAAITHIGGSLRKIKSDFSYDGTLIFIEFILGKAEKSSKQINSIGLSLTILAPNNYEVRMIGHS